MIRILTSHFNNYKKENGIKIPLPMDNINGIVDLLKENIKEFKKVLFVASDINNTHEHVIGYANIFFESMKLVGITFSEYYILDGMSKDKALEYINGADLIFLCGGSVYNQNEFFKTINLRELLKNYDGVVMGQSAGSINMALNVFNSPLYIENSEPIYFDGLGLTDINIEPHFVYDDSLFNEDEKYQRRYIIEESYKRVIYGQCDGSYVLIDNEDNIMIYGETYLIHNGNIKCICKNGEKILI